MEITGSLGDEAGEIIDKKGEGFRNREERGRCFSEKGKLVFCRRP